MAASNFPKAARGLWAYHGPYSLIGCPDTRPLLQTYVWQDYDLCPKIRGPPIASRRLLAGKLEGPLHSVTVRASRLIKPAEIRAGSTADVQAAH